MCDGRVFYVIGSSDFSQQLTLYRSMVVRPFTELSARVRLCENFNSKAQTNAPIVETDRKYLSPLRQCKRL